VNVQSNPRLKIVKGKLNWVKLWVVRRKIFNRYLGGRAELNKLLYFLVRLYNIYAITFLPDSYVLRRYLIPRLYGQVYNAVEQKT
jgi:uncharacterized membrane protein YuzA (DUF378 family)